jgi:hypothetical protein
VYARFLADMGQAKDRLRKALQKQPFCIFCGGGTPAVSIDHCPPKSIFDGFRPKGLEFPQCRECQEGTRPIDLIIGMMSRIYPDPTTEAGRAASRNAIRGLINNHPDLAQVFVVGQKPPSIYKGGTAYPIRLDSDRLDRVVRAFGARLAAGLYFDLIGKPIPPDWPIVVDWKTNFMLDQDQQLDELLRTIGAPRTLVMGKLAVPEAFRYWSGVPPDAPDQLIAFAAFRESFGVTMIVMLPRQVEGYSRDNRVLFFPGFLKGFVP